jgi:hypothetical protein
VSRGDYVIPPCPPDACYKAAILGGRMTAREAFVHYQYRFWEGMDFDLHAAAASLGISLGPHRSSERWLVYLWAD